MGWGDRAEKLVGEARGRQGDMGAGVLHTVGPQRVWHGEVIAFESARTVVVMLDEPVSELMSLANARVQVVVE